MRKAKETNQARCEVKWQNGKRKSENIKNEQCQKQFISLNNFNLRICIERN